MENLVTEKEIETGLQLMKIYHSETDFRRIPLDIESNMLTVIREGRFNDYKAAHYEKIKDNLGTFSVNEITIYSYVVVSAITLFTRIAIEEGVPADDIFDLSDIFLIRLSKCKSLNEIHSIYQLSGEMFAKKIHTYHSSVDKHSYQTEKLLNYISQNIFRKITLQDLAEYSGLSVGHISHIFTDEIGTSLHNYIQREKTNVACNLLIHTDKPISTIASYMGFQSPSNFAAVFRKWQHISPTEYRNKMYREVY